MNTLPTPDLRIDGSRWDHMIRIGRPLMVSKFIVSSARSAVKNIILLELTVNVDVWCKKYKTNAFYHLSCATFFDRNHGCNVQLFFFTGILTTNIMHAVVIIEVQKHLNYKNMIKLTVSWLLEVNICVAERTSCDHVTTNTDWQHRPGWRELLEQHGFSYIRMKIPDIQRCHGISGGASCIIHVGYCGRKKPNQIKYGVHILRPWYLDAIL